jgi:hypothetical protein
LKLFEAREGEVLFREGDTYIPTIAVDFLFFDCLHIGVEQAEVEYISIDGIANVLIISLVNHLESWQSESLSNLPTLAIHDNK